MELINKAKNGQLMSKTGQLTSFITNKNDTNSKDRYI